MGRYKISREEFCLFNVPSRLRILRMHGKFVIFRELNGKITVSIYELSDFWIQVVETYPEKTIINITPVINRRNTHQYLSLELMS